MLSFSQLPVVKKDIIFGAARKFFGPSYFVTALAHTNLDKFEQAWTSLNGSIQCHRKDRLSHKHIHIQEIWLQRISHPPVGKQKMISIFFLHTRLDKFWPDHTNLDKFEQVWTSLNGSIRCRRKDWLTHKHIHIQEIRLQRISHPPVGKRKMITIFFLPFDYCTRIGTSWKNFRPIGTSFNGSIQWRRKDWLTPKHIHILTKNQTAKDITPPCW